MFDHGNLRLRLGRLFAARTSRFDELLAESGVNPKTDLVGADLRGADFAESIIDGWNLSRCDLTGASFFGAKIRNLTIEEALGADLTGAVMLDQLDQKPMRSLDPLNDLIEQIRASTNGAQRSPLILRLLDTHGLDEKAWAFLLNEQLRRERVGRLVNLIIATWEARQPDPFSAGNDLRVQLLQSNGNQYITVRARLLRDLASRLGRNEQVLDLCKAAIEREGYWTSGQTALSILSNVFAGEVAISSYLENLISGRDWGGFRFHVAASLLEGFDSESARETIESAILDASLPLYERSGMLESYCRLKSGDRRAIDFAEQVLQTSSEQELRATVVRAKYHHLDRRDDAAVRKVRTIAAEDEGYQVRLAALSAIGSARNQLQFLIERAVDDAHADVRSAAVRRVHQLGYENGDWYANIFSNDSGSSVRSAALDALLPPNAIAEPQLRDLLAQAISRSEPDYVTARVAWEALQRWPSDKPIVALTQQMINRLPEDMRHWRTRLMSLLAEADKSHVR